MNFFYLYKQEPTPGKIKPWLSKNQESCIAPVRCMPPSRCIASLQHLLMQTHVQATLRATGINGANGSFVSRARVAERLDYAGGDNVVDSRGAHQLV